MSRVEKAAAGSWLRIFGWGGAAALVVVPLIAMQFTREVHWTLSDFVFAGLLVGGTGLALELALRRSGNWCYRGGAVVALGTAFLLTWANAAVGYIGDDNPYNAVFVGIVALAILGSILARFRAQGMALAMAATAAAHAAAGVIGAPQDSGTIPITLLFTAMWLLAAGLFQRAGRDMPE